MVRYALNSFGIMVSATDAKKGESYKCIDPNCKHPKMILKQGKIKTPHFSHYNVEGCDGESSEHRNAKNIISYQLRERSCSFTVQETCPECHVSGELYRFSCEENDEVFEEKRLNSNDFDGEVFEGVIQPDICVLRNGKCCFIVEITKTSATSSRPGKWADIHVGGEFEMKEVYGCFVPRKCEGCKIKERCQKLRIPLPLTREGIYLTEDFMCTYTRERSENLRRELIAQIEKRKERAELAERKEHEKKEKEREKREKEEAEKIAREKWEKERALLSKALAPPPYTKIVEDFEAMIRTPMQLRVFGNYLNSKDANALAFFNRKLINYQIPFGCFCGKRLSDLSENDLKRHVNWCLTHPQRLTIFEIFMMERLFQSLKASSNRG